MNVIPFKSKLSPNQYAMLSLENEVNNLKFFEGMLSKIRSIEYSVFKDGKIIAELKNINEVIKYMGSVLNEGYKIIPTTNEWGNLVIKDESGLYYVQRNEKKLK